MMVQNKGKLPSEVLAMFWFLSWIMISLWESIKSYIHDFSTFLYMFYNSTCNKVEEPILEYKRLKRLKNALVMPLSCSVAAGWCRWLWTFGHPCFPTPWWPTPFCVPVFYKDLCHNNKRVRHLFCSDEVTQMKVFPSLLVLDLVGLRCLWK